MANFNPGTGTIQTTTLEGAALIAAQLLQDLEEAEVANQNNIAVNYFTGDKTVQIQWTTPIVTSLSADGKLQIAAEAYVTSIFQAGGDVKSTALVPATLEIFQRLQALEKAAEDPADPAAKNKVQISYDIDALTGTVNAELPIDFAVAAGTVQVSAVTYL
ncbi:MAG: hypothetical protein RLZZ04_89 [Cyanobacteriota bacterium]|jgi:hypothetical protein